MNRNKIKILVVSQYFPPETGAAASRMGDLSKYLAQNGYDVTVLTEIPNYPEGKYAKGYKFGILNHDRYGKIKVYRSFVIPTRRRNLIERALFYGSYFFGTIFNSFRMPNTDIVLGTSPSPLTGVAAWFISVIKGAKFVLDVRDLWPESVVSLKQMKPGLALTLLGSIEKFIYKRANLICLAVPGFREHIDLVLQSKTDYIDLINGAPDDFFNEQYENIDIEEAKDLSNKFVVFFSGNHGIAQSMETLIEAAIRLREEADIHFLFVGNGIVKPKLKRLSKEMKLNNITFLSSKPRELMPSLIKIASVCIVPLKGIPLFKHAIPSKMFEYLACGIPVILSVAGEASKILKNSGGGITIDPENTDALVESIKFFKNNPDKIKEYGTRGKIYIKKHYKKSDIYHRFSKILIKLVSDL